MSSDLVVNARIRVGTFELDVAFTAPLGQITVVLGPNGAGKSLLLALLAGLRSLDEGRIELGPWVLDDPAAGVHMPAEERPVGLVFQDYRLFPHLDVADNVGFGLRLRGVHRDAARDAASKWIDRFGLSTLEERKPAHLSGGQAQRVALARTLAVEPSALLLDEPTAALDARTRVDVRAELREHLRGFAGPVILVTHDPLEALVMADQVVVIEAGRVVQRGTPADILRRPATDYVARLVGINLYPGTFTADGDRVALDAGGHLVATTTGDVSVGDRVLVALRPSAITLHSEKPGHGSPRNVWEGRVTAMEQLSDRIRVQVDGAPPAVVDITPAAVLDLGLTGGSRVWLSAKATETDAYLGTGG